jgi:hypothetical protein
MKQSSDLNVMALDFDGCMYNKYFYGDSALPNCRGSLPGANYHFLRHNKGKYDLVTLGTARQSYAIDKINAIENSTNLAIFDIEVIAALLTSKTKKTAVCEFMMADIAQWQHNGKSNQYYEVRRFLRDAKKGRTFNNYNIFDWDFDDSKFTLLYAQIHHIASSLKYQA